MRTVEEIDGVKLYADEDFIERVIFTPTINIIIYNINLHNKKSPIRYTGVMETIEFNKKLSKLINNDEETLRLLRDKYYKNTLLKDLKTKELKRERRALLSSMTIEEKQDYYNNITSLGYLLTKDVINSEYGCRISAPLARVHSNDGIHKFAIMYRGEKITITNMEKMYIPYIYQDSEYEGEDLAFGPTARSNFFNLILNLEKMNIIYIEDDARLYLELDN